VLNEDFRVRQFFRTEQARYSGRGWVILPQMFRQSRRRREVHWAHLTGVPLRGNLGVEVPEITNERKLRF
jgi:hypothetical protein